MWGSNEVKANGSLTREMIEDVSKMALNRHGMPTPPMIVPHGMIENLIEWQKRERYWKSLGSLGEKKERLRWRLKHRAKHTIMNLPD